MTRKDLDFRLKFCCGGIGTELERLTADRKVRGTRCLLHRAKTLPVFVPRPQRPNKATPLFVGIHAALALLCRPPPSTRNDCGLVRHLFDYHQAHTNRRMFKVLLSIRRVHLQFHVGINIRRKKLVRSSPRSCSYSSSSSSNVFLQRYLHKLQEYEQHSPRAIAGSVRRAAVKGT